MRIRHGRLHLALHTLSRRDGPTLLLLHALYGCSSDWGDVAARWPGSVYGLDFSGHGESERLSGGSYYAELMVADADAALASVGPARLAGAGLGAYVALLLAGARPGAVPAVLLLPGAGLNGRGPAPTYEKFSELQPPAAGASANGYDPNVCVMELEIRPPDYAAQFAAAAQRVVLLEDGDERPPWWEAVRGSRNVRTVRDLAAGLTEIAA